MVSSKSGADINMTTAKRILPQSLVVSSELDEILALADRVVVMNQGRIAGTLAIEDCTEERLGLLMTGGAVQ